MNPVYYQGIQLDLMVPHHTRSISHWLPLRTSSVTFYQPATYTTDTVLVTLLVVVPRHNRLATVPTLVAGPLAYTLVATVSTLVTGLMAIPVGYDPALVNTAGNQLVATGPKRGLGATRPLQMDQ